MAFQWQLPSVITPRLRVKSLKILWLETCCKNWFTVSRAGECGKQKRSRVAEVSLISTEIFAWALVDRLLKGRTTVVPTTTTMVEDKGTGKTRCLVYGDGGCSFCSLSDPVELNKYRVLLCHRDWRQLKKYWHVINIVQYCSVAYSIWNKWNFRMWNIKHPKFLSYYQHMLNFDFRTNCRIVCKTMQCSLPSWVADYGKFLSELWQYCML